MIETDITDPSTYGSCEIKHGDSITWTMENRSITYLKFVNAFNLGNQSSSIDESYDVIARYEALTDYGNYYLMLNCDLWNHSTIEDDDDSPPQTVNS